MTKMETLRQLLQLLVHLSNLWVEWVIHRYVALDFLLAINVLFLLLGCVLEPGPMLLVIVPIFVPTVSVLGIDLIHFGVIVVINAMIGLVTPPVGMLLFIVTNITKAKPTDIIKDVWPFLLILICALLVVTIWEDFVLYLPRLLGYKG